MLVAHSLSSANAMVGVLRVAACANPARQSSTAARHACWLGWVLRTGSLGLLVDGRWTKVKVIGHPIDYELVDALDGNLALVYRAAKDC